MSYNPADAWDAYCYANEFGICHRCGERRDFAEEARQRICKPCFEIIKELESELEIETERAGQWQPLPQPSERHT